MILRWKRRADGPGLCRNAKLDTLPHDLLLSINTVAVSMYDGQIMSLY